MRWRTGGSIGIGSSRWRTGRGICIGLGGLGHERERSRRPDFPALPADASPWIEPGLPAALGRLSDLQRQSVWLVHGFEWTLTETASRIEADPAGRGTGHPPMYHFGPGLVIAQRDGYVIGALPPDAAVVSTMLRDGTSVWQRPVSGLSLWEETGSDVFTVLNEEGSEILRIEFDGDELPLVTRP